MADDPIRAALRAPERPTAPDARFRDALFERLIEEVGREPVSGIRRRSVRGGNARRALLVAARVAATFVLVALVLWPLRGWLARPPHGPAITAATPFRATIVGSFPSSPASEVGGDFRIRIQYRGTDAWRIDVLGGSAPWQPLINENVSGVGSYLLWDGSNLVAYDGERDRFVPQPEHTTGYSPLNLLGFSDDRSGWERACASGSRLRDATVAGRPVHVLRCEAPPSFSSTAATVELSVDVDSGLVLELVSEDDPGQKFPPGPLAWYQGERIEVTSIDYDPVFPTGAFEPPPGAPSGPAAPPRQRVTTLSIGEVVPSFEGKTLDGSRFELSDHRGTPTVLYVWADWCQPCIDFPLDVLDRASARHDVNIVTVGSGVDGPSIDAFVRDQGYGFTVVVPDDPRSIEGWLPQGIPTLALLDADGRLVGAYAGWNTEIGNADDVEAAIEALVSGDPLSEIRGATSSQLDA